MNAHVIVRGRPLYQARIKQSASIVMLVFAGMMLMLGLQTGSPVWYLLAAILGLGGGILAQRAMWAEIYWHLEMRDSSANDAPEPATGTA